MFADPAFLVPILLAAGFYLVAILFIVYHRRGLEHVGMAMLLFGVVWLLRDPLLPLPWIVIVSGFAFHASGRAKRWWKIDESRDRPDEQQHDKEDEFHGR